MTDQRTIYGFPMFERAQAIAADARERNFPVPCQCETCVSVRNLPAVQRILANWSPIEKAIK